MAIYEIQYITTNSIAIPLCITVHQTHCSKLQHNSTLKHITVLQEIKVNCITLLHITIQYITVYCNVFQYNTTNYRTFQHFT